VQLESESLSSQHASIHITKERDLNSTNGTFINNMPVKHATELMHGDVITVGTEKLMLIDPENQDDGTVLSLNLGGATTLPASKIAELNASALSAEDAKHVIGDILQKIYALSATPVKATAAVLVTLSKLTVDAVFAMDPFNGSLNTWNLGRDESYPTSINNPTVSVSHAPLHFEDSAWWIKDMGSTNGTKVNGKRVVESEINNGDMHAFGKLNCIFGLP
jgi:pSer/pThr/pTyr-binding forkhead associated (FHA) protein